MWTSRAVWNAVNWRRDSRCCGDQGKGRKVGWNIRAVWDWNGSVVPQLLQFGGILYLSCVIHRGCIFHVVWKNQIMVYIQYVCAYVYLCSCISVLSVLRLNCGVYDLHVFFA